MSEDNNPPGSPVAGGTQEQAPSQDDSMQYMPASPTGDSGEAVDTSDGDVPAQVVMADDVYDTNSGTAADTVESAENGDGPTEETAEDAPGDDIPENDEEPRSRSASPVAASRDNSPVPEGSSTIRRALYSDDDDDEDETPKKKKKVVLDSDDEDDDGNEKSESPAKKNRVLMSSDDDDSGNEGGDSGLKKKRLGSDISDSENEGDNDKPRGEEEVGELMANIFGDESDEEGGGGADGDEGRPAGNDDDDDDEGMDDQQRYRRDRDEDPGFEWDFDTMLRNKKAEKRKKKRRRDGGIDIINDDDGTIALMVEAMKNATKEDRNSNMQRQPALRKRKMLSEVKTMLLRVDMMEAMIDNGMMSAVSDWLSPLPDKSLPALEIRTELLKLLQGFTRLEQSILKQSGLGKAVMMLYKHPRETKPNKEIAAKLIREWARPIFQLETDFRSVSKEERVQRDLDHMPQIKKRRLSSDAGPSGQSGSGGGSLQDDLRPGDKGYIGRARVPKASTRDYVVRPRSHVDGEFKGERKSKGYNRLDKTQRDFMERTKKHKAKRAVNVSLEGRNMAL